MRHRLDQGRFRPWRSHCHPSGWLCRCRCKLPGQVAGLAACRCGSGDTVNAFRPSGLKAAGPLAGGGGPGRARHQLTPALLGAG
jgi:hypothetical protein